MHLQGTTLSSVKNMEQFAPRPATLDDMDEHDNIAQPTGESFYSNLDDAKDDQYAPHYSNEQQELQQMLLYANAPDVNTLSDDFPHPQGQNGQINSLFQDNPVLAAQCADNLSENMEAEQYLNCLSMDLKVYDANSTKSEALSEFTEEADEGVPKLSRAQASALTDREKKQRRKNLNREAACRSRAKKRSKQDVLEGECKRLKIENEEMAKRVKTYEAEKFQLLAAIKKHYSRCPLSTRRRNAIPNTNPNVGASLGQNTMPNLAPILQQNLAPPDAYAHPTGFACLPH